jgi:hypothetical protein
MQADKTSGTRPPDGYDARQFGEKCARGGMVSVRPYIGELICLPSGEQARNGYHEYQLIQNQRDRRMTMDTTRTVATGAKPMVPTSSRSGEVWTPFGLH